MNRRDRKALGPGQSFPLLPLFPGVTPPTSSHSPIARAELETQTNLKRHREFVGDSESPSTANSHVPPANLLASLFMTERGGSWSALREGHVEVNRFALLSRMPVDRRIDERL